MAKRSAFEAEDEGSNPSSRVRHSSCGSTIGCLTAGRQVVQDKILVQESQMNMQYFRAGSSSGQSKCLLSTRPWVRIPPSPCPRAMLMSSTWRHFVMATTTGDGQTHCPASVMDEHDCLRNSWTRFESSVGYCWKHDWVPWPSGKGTCPTNKKSTVRVRPGLFIDSIQLPEFVQHMTRGPSCFSDLAACLPS